jgi:Ni/Co efflux regulator RcnB
MIKSKSSMAVAAAALAMCMAGSAFAQDQRFERGHDRGHGDGRSTPQQYERRGGPDQYRGHDDHRRGNGYYRGDDRRAYSQAHAQWHRGGRVPPQYRGRGYVVDDWRGHRLQQPPRGYQWVGVGGEFALAAIATGLIAQIIIGAQ